MTFPAPTRADHQKFCEREGWASVRNARGKTGTHHVTYELILPDGRILRSRISHPPDRTTYGPSLWNHILRDQLSVTEVEFWACVRSGDRPARTLVPQQGTGIPADLAYQLIVKFRVPEPEVANMTRQEALNRITELWAGKERP